MIVQRQNPAYRSAYLLTETVSGRADLRIGTAGCFLVSRMNLYNHKIRNKKLVGTIVVAAILGMFVLRGVLLGSGTIEKMYTLEPDELHTALSKYEVTIQAAQGDGKTVLTGGGTILDGRKNSSKEENYTLTIAAAAHAAGDSDTVTVVLPDGSSAEGTVIRPETVAGDAASLAQDVVFIQCSCPEELDVYYSRDILDRLAAGDAAYALKDGELVSGEIRDADATVDGLGDSLILADIGSEEGMSGGGLYGKAGNYLGMILQGTQDGLAACISGRDVVELLNKVL